MTEYIYKGLKIVYTLEPHKNESHLFGSTGFVVDPKEPSHAVLARFHTDYNTLNGAKTAIRKLIENYIDFEWHQSKERV